MRLQARAPLRIDFAGGWSDVPTYAERAGGAVVNAAIDLYAHVEVVLGERRIRLHALDLDEHVTLPSSQEIRYDGTLDLHKAALNMLPVTGGVEILTRSDAPSGSGLGASGALDVALLATLARAREEAYEPRELAEFGFLLETGELGLLGGRQDQYAAALGGFHRFEFGPDTVRANALAVPPDAIEELTRHLVLVYTGHSHFSSATHGAVWEAFRRGESDVTAALHRIRELADDAARALEAGDWPHLARVVDENWTQQQRLDWSIATVKSNTIEQAVRAAGAWGVKATGAGAGGCLAVLCPETSHGVVSEAAVAVGGTVLAYGFASRGVEVWEERGADMDR